MKKYIVFCAVLMLSLFGVLSLFGTSYFPMHDDTQVGRVVAMSRSLKDGQFPVRWVADLGFGYGYPLFNFYGPLPYYIGAVLTNVGIPALIATKVMMGIGMIMAPLLAFVVLAPYIGITGASIAALLFMYAPYHAVQLYVRGAVGELYATAFLPLLFLGLVAPLLGKRTHRIVFWGALGVALTILSHTILGYVTIILYGVWTAVYVCVSLFQKKKFKSVLFIYVLEIGIGLLLSAFFWLPAVFEMAYTNVAGQIGGAADFRSHFVCARQLLYSAWGFGGSIAGCTDGMSFKLGVVHIGLFLYAMFLWYVKRSSSSYKNHVFIAGLVISVVGIFFMLPVSTWVWQYIPNFSYVQYPWRFLSIASFGIAVIGGMTFANSSTFMRRIFSLVVIVLVLIANRSEFRPQQLTHRSMVDYESTEELRFRVSKISDEYLPKDIVRPSTVFEVSDAIFESERALGVRIVTEKSNYINAMLFSSSDQNIRVLKAWFPGWHYFINGKEVSVSVIEGFPIFRIFAGSNMVELRLSDTRVRTVGNMMSLVAVMLCFIFYIRYEKNNT